MNRELTFYSKVRKLMELSQQLLCKVVACQICWLGDLLFCTIEI